MSPALRIGLGYDVHPFAETDRPLVLGGVEVSATGGLAGHSDADAVAHAVADALLGAAGLADIGILFPASDSHYAGIDSMELLAGALALVREAGWSVANVDVVVHAERPKLAPHVPAMIERLTEALDAPANVKAKHGEGVGAIGRAEAIAVHAVALLTAS